MQALSGATTSRLDRMTRHGCEEVRISRHREREDRRMVNAKIGAS
jgi:hypothetical protein